MAYVDIDSITTWCTHTTGRGEDGASQEADMVATIDVVGPERTVLDVDILYGHMARIADIYEAWTLCILVGTLAVPGATDPEFLPIVIAVTIDGSVACNGKTITLISIDEGREILAGFSLNTGFQDRKVGNAVTTFQFTTLFEIEMGFRTEE